MQIVSPFHRASPVISLVLLGLLSLVTGNECRAVEVSPLRVQASVGAPGRQLVRLSLPFPKGFLREGQAVLIEGQGQTIRPGLRPLTTYPSTPGQPTFVRRALATFVWDFGSGTNAVFALRSSTPSPAGTTNAPALVRCESMPDGLKLQMPGGSEYQAIFLAPARSSSESPRLELVESNAFFLWQRWHFADVAWPRILEVRTDALGGCVLVAHIRRDLSGDGRAPGLGWEIRGLETAGRLEAGARKVALSSNLVTHSFAKGEECLVRLGTNQHFYHPAAPLKRRGAVEVQTNPREGFLYRYWRCRAADRVPMQESAWQRAELVLTPTGASRVTATLEPACRVQVDWRVWDDLYDIGPPLELSSTPDLQALVEYHHQAMLGCSAVGDDWGNITGYADGVASGGVFGMNRLNHGPAMFEEAWRSGDWRLRDAALLWCGNFHDQSIWWGSNQRGGTRYNNIRGMNRTPPDNDDTYMWRSNGSVNFCTKGYDSFFLAYEETGDPRMLEALEAQLEYASRHLHVDQGECRNIGDVRDFVRLFAYTGRGQYLAEARRLFAELRNKLSPDHLFDQGGKPIHPHPPFIEEDEGGLKVGYAKPYIIGYALAGLPHLGLASPNEPRLRETVQAVADFLASSQDAAGGWRYPHPRSSFVILSQGIEHAWQLVQAGRLVGAQPNHLDAIQRVLRQRFHSWKSKGRLLSSLTGWETVTGKVRQRNELYALYPHPEDRDATRDYAEGRADFGSSPPEGLVYLPEVLAYYLRHREARTLTNPPTADEPLGKILR